MLLYPALVRGAYVVSVAPCSFLRPSTALVFGSVQLSAISGNDSGHNVEDVPKHFNLTTNTFIKVYSIDL